MTDLCAIVSPLLYTVASYMHAHMNTHTALYSHSSQLYSKALECTWNSVIIPRTYMLLDSYLAQLGSHI